jgi:hypothetical protein
MATYAPDLPHLSAAGTFLTVAYSSEPAQLTLRDSTKHGLDSADSAGVKIPAVALTVLMLPLLSGCVTSYTVQHANEPASSAVPDKIYHVEKAMLSKDQQLVIYLEGCLSNSSQRNRFTLTFSSEQIRNVTQSTYSFGTNTVTWSSLGVSREAIQPGWIPQDENSEIVPVGKPIPTPFSGTSIEYYYCAFGEYAKLLPDSTKTLYPIVERRIISPRGWPAGLEFLYVDASLKRNYTIISAEQVTVPSNRNKGFYGLLPLTVPVDIVTAPIQGIGLLLWMSALGHSGG